MANLVNLTFDDIDTIDLTNIEIGSNSKATIEQVDNIAELLSAEARSRCPTYQNLQNDVYIDGVNLTKLTSWLLLNFAENGTSQVTEYPRVQIAIQIEEETVAAAAAIGLGDGTPGNAAAVAQVLVQRATTIRLDLAAGIIKTVTSVRHWARYYADLTYRLAKSKQKKFTWGRNNGVPVHFAYLGFDTANFVDQTLLSIDERRCIRTCGAFALLSNPVEVIVSEDQKTANNSRQGSISQ